MLGLDAAGKTSEFALLQSFSYHIEHYTVTAILYKLKLNQSVTTIPTGAYSALRL